MMPPDTAYRITTSQVCRTAPVQSRDLPETEASSDEPEEDLTKERKPWVNWAALLPRVASLMSASLIVLFAAALFLGSCWCSSPADLGGDLAIAGPLWDQVIVWLNSFWQRFRAKNVGKRPIFPQ